MACKVLLLMLVVVPAALIPPGGVPPAAAAPPPIQRWVMRYDNAPVSGPDEATALAVDGAGNVYVTGDSWGGNPATGGTGYDYATVKYDTYGNQQWVPVARYDGPDSGDDKATALAVDGAGNVYVTGRSDDLAPFDYATVKYDANGNQQWVARYNGPVNGADDATALAVDAAGNVYVTGTSAGSGTYADYATVKYNGAGAQQWVARYNGPGNGDDGASALAVDGAGNVYVTGVSYGGSGTGGDYATVKYNAGGVQQWVARYNNAPVNGIDDATALAVDGAGNVYVTGESWGGLLATYYDYATIKYDAGGAQQWVRRYDGAPGPVGLDDGASALAVDGAGNVYVTGVSYDGSGTGGDYATVKYNAAGVQKWVARYNNASVNGLDEAKALAVDASGNVYVTGWSESSWNPDYATVKYNAAGAEQWVARYNGPGTNVDQANAVALDGAGNVYVTGKSTGSGTEYDYATIKYVQQEPHYACHLAPGVVDPGIVITETQFGGQRFNPGLGNYLCAPALKNGEGVPDTETAHLRCFDAEAAQSAPNRLVNLTTQFGELQNVVVGDRALLCAPASKTLYPQPPLPEPPEPHYLCYSITGPAVNEEVTVQSQFYPLGLPTNVGEPQLLCLPAGKNGDPIPDAPHEVCYGVSLPPAPMFYNVRTQFDLEEKLEVLAGQMLCVPAVKVEVEPPETSSFSVKAGAPSGLPPDAILKLNPVNGLPVVAIPPAGLGLGTAGPDDLASLSYGMEYPDSMTPFLRFSMGPDPSALPQPQTDGRVWSGVFAESTCMAWPGQATGDEFDAPMPPNPPAAFNTNSLVLDENGVQDAGLPGKNCAAPPGYPVGTGTPPGGAPPGDDLDALEDRPPSFVDADGNGIPERPVFFSLTPWSPTLPFAGATPADILWSAGGMFPPMVYAPAPMLGLIGGADAIDALMLYDNGDLTFGCGDWAWLSLTPGSPKLAALGATEGDVLFVDGCNPGMIQVQYDARQLGLCNGLHPIIGGCNTLGNFDDVDALKGALPCLGGDNAHVAIGNGTGIAGDDASVPNGNFPPATVCVDTDDDHDGYLDQ
jgi:hypothetical protein